MFLKLYFLHFILGEKGRRKWINWSLSITKVSVVLSFVPACLACFCWHLLGQKRWITLLFSPQRSLSLHQNQLLQKQLISPPTAAAVNDPLIHSYWDLQVRPGSTLITWVRLLLWEIVRLVGDFHRIRLNTSPDIIKQSALIALHLGGCL